MWNVVLFTSRIVNPLRLSNLSIVGKRTFLSESYRCKDAWQQRLKSPLLSKVNSSAMFQELDHQFTHFGRANAVDVDIFFNSLTDMRFIDEVDYIVNMLRLSPDSGNTLPSTPQAVIRLLLDNGRRDTLLKILSDRLKYGIFPDHYSCNLMMDTFLKEKDYAAAARVGVTQMLQEDWENLLTTRLSVYSCHMYLLNSEQPWLSEEEIVPPVKEPKDVVRVRVKYIREPYFDDHFDLVEPKMLLGKTLTMFCSKMEVDNNALVSSYRILGLTLHKKWQEAIEIAASMSAPKSVYKDAITLARKSLINLQGTEDATSGDQEQPADKTSSEIKETAEEEIIRELDCLLRTLEKNGIDQSMLSFMESSIQEAVKLQEEKDIAEQKELYIKWEEDRVTALQNYLAEVKKEEDLKRIEKQKLELIEEEREIFFFDNENEFDLKIAEKERKQAEYDAEHPVWKKKKIAEDDAEEYFPSDIKNVKFTK